MDDDSSISLVLSDFIFLNPRWLVASVGKALQILSPYFADNPPEVFVRAAQIIYSAFGRGPARPNNNFLTNKYGVAKLTMMSRFSSWSKSVIDCDVLVTYQFAVLLWIEKGFHSHRLSESAKCLQKFQEKKESLQNTHDNLLFDDMRLGWSMKVIDVSMSASISNEHACAISRSG